MCNLQAYQGYERRLSFELPLALLKRWHKPRSMSHALQIPIVASSIDRHFLSPANAIPCTQSTILQFRRSRRMHALHRPPQPPQIHTSTSPYSPHSSSSISLHPHPLSLSSHPNSSSPPPSPSSQIPPFSPSTSSPPRYSPDSHHSALLTYSSPKSISSLRSVSDSIFRSLFRSGADRRRERGGWRCRRGRWRRLYERALAGVVIKYHILSWGGDGRVRGREGE